LRRLDGPKLPSDIRLALQEATQRIRELSQLEAFNRTAQP
jgi:hypothetical protein